MSGQMASVLMCLLLLSSLGGCSAGKIISDFTGVGDEATLKMEPPGMTRVVNISIPADCVVLGAIMDVRGLPAEGCLTDYPAAPSVALNRTTLWAFNGTGYGALGMQEVLSNGARNATMAFGPGGGSGYLTLRLPKNATVTNATGRLSGSRAGVHVREVMNFTGEATGNMLGATVANAGDVNKDGYDDLFTGSPYNSAAGTQFGRAYLFFGNSSLDNVADLKFDGWTAEMFANTVAGAGDVNGDGYDDVVIGAPQSKSGGTNAGAAYLYLGGPTMDTKVDVTFAATDWYNYLGTDVACAGDVNGDGYDDIVIGAPGNTSGGKYAGRAYIYYGGATMNNVADVVLTGTNVDMNFGISVATAGDVNGDGYDDVIIGEYRYDAVGTNAGRATIFFGGKSMDSVPDVTLRGKNAQDQFGTSVSTAGDVNKDGYDDVIVGAWHNGAGASASGSAYIYFGGSKMNITADLQLNGAVVENGYFGWTVSDAGDVNGDGYDDVMVKESNRDVNGSEWGAVRVFFGGANMDNMCDAYAPGRTAGEAFGCSLSSLGDINKDGYVELAAGARGYSVEGNFRGRAYVFSIYSPMERPAVKMGGATLFQAPSLDGTENISDFAGALNAYLRAEAPAGTDQYGNTYIDVALNLSAGSDGNLTLSGLDITYEHDAAVPDFSGALNAYIEAHRGEAANRSNLTVPLEAQWTGEGGLKLFNLAVTIDEPPAFISPITGLALDEDTANETLLDLFDHFRDDWDENGKLQFFIDSATNRSRVNFTIRDNRYLAADALTGSGNDNWTGVVEARIGCTDGRNLSRLSNTFDLVVRNVNDAPLITSAPRTDAVFRKDYSYKVTAVDGDNDPLVFALRDAPAGMTIDAGTGNMLWLPTVPGRLNVSISVSDGNLTSFQNFTLTVSSNPDNRIPRIITSPGQNATVGLEYIYDVDAIDDDGDPVDFSLREAPQGMGIDPSSGRINWTPTAAGTFRVSVAASDGQAVAYQDWSLVVGAGSGNRPPRFTSTAPLAATVGMEYSYQPAAVDDDGDALTFSLILGPSGMTVNSTNGRVLWIPQSGQNGTNPVTFEVRDSRGNRAEQSFTINVSGGTAGTRPDCAITSPVHLQKVGGKVTLAGTASKGSARVTRVEVRIDGGDWVKASGTESWTFTVDTAQLPNGEHRFEARSFDDSLWSDTAAVAVTVSNKAPGGQSGTPFPWMLVVAVVVVVMVIALLALLMMRKKPTTVIQYQPPPNPQPVAPGPLPSPPPVLPPPQPPAIPPPEG